MRDYVRVGRSEGWSLTLVHKLEEEYKEWSMLALYYCWEARLAH